MNGNNLKKAILVLTDGLVFDGFAFGADGEAIGEVVFNTSITGYQEILTDPSYKGQIVTMTYSQIGNYGINEQDIESKGGIKAEGLIVKEACTYPSNWRATMSLPDYMKEHGIVGLQGIDTRALTRHLRDHGAQMGIVSSQELNPERLLEKLKNHPGIDGVDLVKEVTAHDSFGWDQRVWRWELQHKLIAYDKKPHQSSLAKPSLVVYDFGVKLNILRNLIDTGFDVTVVPAQTPAEAVLERNPDAILLSNGPGDPSAVSYAVETTKKLLLGKKPIFGICMGHQILGLALGGDVYKLKFGHHGGNHPVMDLATGKVAITSQNHNYCVDIKSLRGQVELTHKNLYDGTEEGMLHKELPVLSVQYHPEASPGPEDSRYIFRRFLEMLKTS